MTNNEVIGMHRLLAGFHNALAEGAQLDIVKRYHSDFAVRLAREAARIEDDVRNHVDLAQRQMAALEGVGMT